MEEMKLPKFYGLVNIVSIVGAVIGCLAGIFLILESIEFFRYGFIQGIAAISSGSIIILSSLVSLGLILCFLSIVKAQIDTRNMMAQLIKKEAA